MKTQGMLHQLAACKRMEGRRTYALFMEQGTGKTWTLLADAERLYAKGTIDALLVVAPNGVHTNWIRREIPAHMEGNILARYWRSGAGVRHTRWLDEIMKPREEGESVPLRILSMNIDALVTKKGYDYAERFLLATKALIIIDESGRIKNPDAARTKALMKLRQLAKGARIATGTPITRAPTDVFAQMQFLEDGLLGTTSYRAFVAEYADVLPTTHPLMQNMVRRNPKAAYAQIIAKNPDGSPRWRNLDKLQKLLEPHSFRVLKRDCLDLPEKIYKVLPFELEPEQRRVYEKMAEENRIELDDRTELPVSELAALVKLQQITSGFVNLPGGQMKYVSEDNPRLKALLDAVEDVDGKFVVWARFIEEIYAVRDAMERAGVRAVTYFGETSTADREAAVDGFQQDPEVRCFIGNAQAAGIGLTLTAGETVFYFSNSFDLDHRLQSEDRCHRIGTRNNVVYIDLVAEDTVDEKIARNLRRKKNTAAIVLGDQRAEVEG
jgi:SNF2 family DNA or RNA helicase